MIQNNEEYERALAIIAEEKERLDNHAKLWKSQGMTDVEIKRLIDPMMCLHLGLVEEADAWKNEHPEPKLAGGCMGPERPGGETIKQATQVVVNALRERGVLTQDEESLHAPMAESRRRVLWLLEKAVDEMLWQDACENF